jgi:hypothetical protein
MKFVIELYNDQGNAQVFNLFIHLLLPNMFQAFFKPIFRGRCTNQQWFKSLGYGVSARVLTPYPAELNHCRNCTPASSEDGLKEILKHVRPK